MTSDAALKVPCPLCKMPAESGCVNTVNGTARDEPHHNRAVRAHIVSSAIAENLAIEESA